MVRSLVFALVVVFAVGALKANADVTRRPPNVVIIFADDLGYGDLGCYGATKIKTPSLDRLAREGTRFTNFHVSQPVCSASRTALLTGCYSNRLGINGALGPQANIGISDQETTLAQMLKARSYATGMAGKWHLGHRPPFLPTRHGFDEYLGLPYSNDMWPFHPDQTPRGNVNFPKLPLIEGEKAIDADVTAEDQTQLTKRYTERAVDFIKKHKSEPFFFYLAHSMPHVPLFTSERFRGKSAGGTYGDVIEEIDWSVGEVMKALHESGVEDNTLIIFTSDNGPWLSYGTHAGTAGVLREGKGTCWEGGIRTPFIARFPGKIPSGKVSDAMFMSIDILPTIAKLTGSVLPRQAIDGMDVGPILLSKPGAKNPHTVYYWYYEQNQLQAVSSGDGRWKLQLPHEYRTLDGKPGGDGGKPVRYVNKVIEEPELYDLTNDIGETKNVATEHPEVVHNLLAEAEKARAEMGDSLTKRTGSKTRPSGKVAAAPAGDR